MTFRLFQRVVCAFVVTTAFAECAEAQACNADFNRDGMIDGLDMAVVLAGWGTCSAGASCSADLDSDGLVGGSDLTVLLAAWGPCTPPVDGVPAWATLLNQEPDPAVVTDVALRNAITATGYAWRVRDNATQIEMVLIPPGNFQMGCSQLDEYACSSSSSYELPHQVTLTRPFYLSRYEVTQAQWTARMGYNPSGSQGADFPEAPIHPVERVSWDMVSVYMALTGMRFPTEAEWEYAYRAGTTTAFHAFPGYPNGTSLSALADNIAWRLPLSNGRTHTVGQKYANGFGLHDMSGNVWEWVSDWDSNTYYANSPPIDPPGPATPHIPLDPNKPPRKIIRGGSALDFTNGATRYLTAFGRWSGGVWETYGDVGFRVARNPQ